MAENADNMDISDNTTNSMNTKSSNVTTLPEWVSDEVIINTYIAIGVSILIAIVGLANFVWLQYKFPRRFVFKVLQMDCLVCSVSQAGFIGILLSSIAEEPNSIVCANAAVLNSICNYHFIWSGLSIAIARRMKENASAVAKPIPPDLYFTSISTLISFCICLFLFSVSFFNYHMDLHCIPPFDFCQRTHPVHIKPSTFPLILIYTPPISMIIVNLVLDHSSALELQNPTLNLTPLRTSNVSVGFIAMAIFHEGYVVESHWSNHYKMLSICGAQLLFLLIKGPLLSLWADKVEQENMRKEQEHLQQQTFDQTVHEPAQPGSSKKRFSANQRALTMTRTHADISAEINSWKWKWLVRFSNPKKYCWHNQECISIIHQMKSVNYTLLPPPKSSSYLSYLDHFTHLYNVRDKFLIYEPVQMVSLLAEEFIITDDMTPAVKEETRNKINNDYQHGELLLEALSRCDILDDFIPVTQTRIVTEPCQGCGKSVPPVVANKERNPYFELQCPLETSIDEEKHLPSMFATMMATNMGGDDCPYPGCEKPGNTKRILKQLFTRVYQGFAICVNRVRTKLDGTRVKIDTELWGAKDNITVETVNGYSVEYQMISCVQHVGSNPEDGGHYLAHLRSPNEGIFYLISDSAPVTISKEVDIDRSQLFHYGLVKVQKQKVHNTSLYVLKQNTAEYYF